MSCRHGPIGQPGASRAQEKNGQSPSRWPDVGVDSLGSWSRVSPSPLRPRLFELVLERLPSSRIAAQTSRRFTETDQLFVGHSTQTLKPLLIARIQGNGHAGLPAEVGSSFYYDAAVQPVYQPTAPLKVFFCRPLVSPILFVPGRSRARRIPDSLE